MPTCEILFKGGETLQEDLRKYVKSRGWHHWMTVQTSDSGSYDETNILEFLDRHLEKGPEDRPWRILLVDDFGPHKTDAVRRLAWTRKYIVVVHGGGATSVAQTNDTDQNQHVRRMYTEEESYVLLQKSAALAQKVPVLSHEQTINIFGMIWQRDEVHCKAREGYMKTGATVPLEGDDREICREAEIFWKERGMKDKRSSITAAVRHQHQAGRLPWTFDTVYNGDFMKPYPKAGKMDETLAGQFDADWPDDDLPWEEDAPTAPAGHGDGHADSHGDGGDDDGDGGDDDDNGGADGGVGSHGDGDALLDLFDAPGEEAAAVLALAVPDAATDLEQAHHNKVQRLLEQRRQSLELGMTRLLVAIDRELHSEHKRFKGVRQAHPAVVTAMQQRQVAERDLLAKQRADVVALNDKKRSLKDLERDSKDAREKLRALKAEMKQAQRDCDEVFALKTFSLQDLGHGKRNKGDLKKAKKVRHEVLDRMSLLGAGLSAEQTRDYEFFKSHWDDANEAAMAAEWPRKFAELTQHVQDAIAAGDTNAFSKFVHAETERCLSDIPRLRL